MFTDSKTNFNETKEILGLLGGSRPPRQGR